MPHLRYFLVLVAVIVMCNLAPLSAQSIPMPGGRMLNEVDFERHVHAILDRKGCNAGGCHGSSRGKGGFSLSLIAESPERDHETLIRYSRGRLINYSAPEQSVLLQYPLAGTAHPGGKRFERDSWEYEVIRRWIAAGARRQPGSGTVADMEVEPACIDFARIKESRPLRVFVRFADGARHDMTPFCDFRHSNEKVIRVSGQGEVTGLAHGVETILVVYRGHVVAVPVAVALPARDNYPNIAAANYIDREIFARLRHLHVVPAPVTNDAEFLRRVYVDVIGSLPTPEDVRGFLADKKPDKRARKIDELLKHPRHAAILANQWLIWTGNSTDGRAPFQFGLRGWRQLWFDWLRHRFENNVPFDQVVENIVCADSREGKSPESWLGEAADLVKRATNGLDSDYRKRRTLDLFWRSFDEPHEPAERIASAFLGIRLDCARCHKHPLARWTPADHRAFSAIFSAMRHDNSPATAPLAKAELDQRRQALIAALDVKGLKPESANAIHDRHQLDLWGAALKEVYVGDQITVAPRGPAPATGSLDLSRSTDPRRDFARWLAARDNPYFARNIVNRTWAYYFGRGLVEPFDGFSDANPPSNPALLDLLAKDFLAGGFDFRRLERTILNSRAYQLAFVPPAPHRPDPALFANRQPIRVIGRVELDMISDAAGGELKLEMAPPGARAIEIVDLRGLNAYVHEGDHWNERDEAMIRLFARKEPMNRCRSGDHGNYLHMLGYPSYSKLLADGKRLKAFAAWERSDDSLLDELFLATLARTPSKEERDQMMKHLTQYSGDGKRNETIEKMLWALLHCPEFVTRR